MASISELSANFAEKERPAGNLLDEVAVLAQAVAAVRFYSGYAALAAHAGVSPAPEISGDTVISVSEWAIIRPLFMLYIEREQSLQLEATRHMGLDVFGRSSSEVQGDINQVELSMPHLASMQMIISI